MWSGLWDKTCSNKQARETRDTIGERVTRFLTVPWAWHTNWGGKYGAKLYPLVIDALTNPENKSYAMSDIAITI